VRALMGFVRETITISQQNVPAEFGPIRHYFDKAIERLKAKDLDE
jgi:hypothetical protein